MRGVYASISACYLVYSFIALYNWLSTIAPGLSPTSLALHVPGDLGLSISLLTVGLLFAYASLKGEGSTLGLGSLLIGCIVGASLAALQLMVAAAALLDSVLASLMGEGQPTIGLEVVLRPDVVLGIAPALLAPRSWRMVRRSTER